MRRQSPFPGMDPFLEQPALWAGVHHRLITTLSDMLTERIWPAYFVQIEERVYVVAPEHPDRWTIVPDVFVVHGTAPATAVATLERITEPTLVAPLLDLTVREWYIEIHDTRSREVVTTIEVLSPFNKAPGTQGRDDFLRKRSRVMGSHASWIEIDLLRAGERPIEAVGKSEYYTLLKREDISEHFEVWYTGLRDPLPTIAVPLRAPDADAPLNLQVALETVYRRGGYAAAVDYDALSPAPPLTPPDAAWVAACLAAWRSAEPEPV
jgi:Protein of unknown function (DUF4058)